MNLYDEILSMVNTSREAKDLYYDLNSRIDSNSNTILFIGRTKQSAREMMDEFIKDNLSSEMKINTDKLRILKDNKEYLFKDIKCVKQGLKFKAFYIGRVK